MLGMGKPVHIFQLGASEEMVWLPLPLLMLKKRRKKISKVIKKKHLFNRECFY
jgi:hypothetical protein